MTLWILGQDDSQSTSGLLRSWLQSNTTAFTTTLKPSVSIPSEAFTKLSQFSRQFLTFTPTPYSLSGSTPSFHSYSPGNRQSLTLFSPDPSGLVGLVLLAADPRVCDSPFRIMVSVSNISPGCGNTSLYLVCGDKTKLALSFKARKMGSVKMAARAVAVSVRT
jgi:hypothetical protein